MKTTRKILSTVLLLVILCSCMGCSCSSCSDAYPDMPEADIGQFVKLTFINFVRWAKQKPVYTNNLCIGIMAVTLLAILVLYIVNICFVVRTFRGTEDPNKKGRCAFWRCAALFILLCLIAWGLFFSWSQLSIGIFLLGIGASTIVNYLIAFWANPRE